MNNELKIVVIQRRLTHYRVSFFEKLKVELELLGVQLILIHGQPNPSEITKQDEGFVNWAIQERNHYWKFGNKYLTFQPYPLASKEASLVVITQENGILSNYLHLYRHFIFGTKIAFWGHGANLQSKYPNGLKERFKRWTTKQVDWWFAYTQMSADLITAAGFPQNHITILNNSIDTDDMQQYRNTINLGEIFALRESLAFKIGPIGVFVGSLYEDKRLDFLFEAAEIIRLSVPDFNLLIIGDGNEREKVKAWCANYSWVRWVGPRFNREKVVYISMADIMLNPGLVGLGILDSFVCEVPMLTTACGLHSPEISYLENDVNGIMTIDDVNTYAASCAKLLCDSKQLEVLREGCRDSSKKYTVKNMASRFADGVIEALRS